MDTQTDRLTYKLTERKTDRQIKELKKMEEQTAEK